MQPAPQAAKDKCQHMNLSGKRIAAFANPESNIETRRHGSGNAGCGLAGATPPRPSTARRINRVEIGATQIKDLRIQSAMLRDPFPNVFWISGPQNTIAIPAYLLTARRRRIPCSVKCKYCPGRDTYTVARNSPENHRTSRSAGSVDDHSVTRCTESIKLMQIFADLAARIVRYPDFRHRRNQSDCQPKQD